MRAITTPTTTINEGTSFISSAGFNPNDGTFYTCCLKGLKMFVKIYAVKDSKVEFLYKNKKFSPYSIMFNPADKTTLIGFFGPGIFIHRSVPNVRFLTDGMNIETLHSCDSEMSMLSSRGGFSPDGTVFFVCDDSGFKFFKVQNVLSTSDNNVCLGTIRNFKGRVNNGGFLDNEHFFVCSSLGVKIYQVPSCNTWEKDSITETSFKEIKVLENSVPCSAAVLSPVYIDTQDNIKELSTNSDKAKKTFSDATIHIQAD